MLRMKLVFLLPLLIIPVEPASSVWNGHCVVQCVEPPGDCCPSMMITSGPSLRHNISGVYTWAGVPKNDKPMYVNGDYCLLYAGHWKVEMCKHGDLKGAEGFIKAPATQKNTCPKDVNSWTYYPGEDGGGVVVKVECVVDCAVSGWMPWGMCSSSCGGGTRKRTRAVTTPKEGGGEECPSLSESESCNVEACPVPSCEWNDWGTWEGWGECHMPEPIGSGCRGRCYRLRNRNRSCKNENCSGGCTGDHYSTKDNDIQSPCIWEAMPGM